MACAVGTLRLIPAPMPDDAGAFALFALALLAFVGLGEALRAWGGWRPEASRRVVHALTGLAVAACPPLFTGPGPIYALAVAFIGVNLVAIRRGLLLGMHGIARRSLGTVTFPLALVFALWACWTLDPGRIYVLQTAFLVLALSDPLASLVGSRLRRPGRVRVGQHPKSIAGSAAFFLSAWALTAGALAGLGPVGMTPGQTVGAAFVAAGLATAAEAVMGEGWDNLGIVVAAVVALIAAEADPGAVGAMVVALGVAVAFGVAARVVGFLALDGALAAGLLAFGVLALGGWAWAVPAATFFVLSSLLSKLGRRRKAGAAALAEKGSTRDAGQVLANGGVGGALLVGHLLFPEAGWVYWAFAGSFAAAAADTWGTEVGTLVGGPTRLAWSGRRVPPGTSGGVSAAGALGALAGAAVVFTSLVPFAEEHLAGMGWGTAGLVVVGGGWLAGFVDSLLGATVQARYRDAAGAVTERAASAAGPHPLVRGWRAVTNDRVNLLCTLSGAALPALALWIL